MVTVGVLGAWSLELWQEVIEEVIQEVWEEHTREVCEIQGGSLEPWEEEISLEPCE